MFDGGGNQMSSFGHRRYYRSASEFTIQCALALGSAVSQNNKLQHNLAQAFDSIPASKALPRPPRGWQYRSNTSEFRCALNSVIRQQ